MHYTGMKLSNIDVSSTSMGGTDFHDTCFGHKKWTEMAFIGIDLKSSRCLFLPIGGLLSFAPGSRMQYTQQSHLDLSSAGGYMTRGISR